MIVDLDLMLDYYAIYRDDKKISSFSFDSIVQKSNISHSMRIRDENQQGDRERDQNQQGDREKIRIFFIENSILSK